MNELLKTLNEGNKGRISIEEELLQYWNQSMKEVKVPKHKSINSQVMRITNKITGDTFPKTLRSIISEALMMNVDVEKLKIAIDNYRVVMSSSEYFFKTRYNMGEFIYWGIYSNSGFKNFLPENNPLIKYKRRGVKSGSDPNRSSDSNTFNPITESYTKIYDSERRTFFGFKLDKIFNYKDREKDLKDFLERNQLDFTYFCELELVLAGIIYFNKKEPRLVDMYNYMKLWKENRSKFEDQAERKRDW